MIFNLPPLSLHVTTPYSDLPDAGIVGHGIRIVRGLLKPTVL